MTIHSLLIQKLLSTNAHMGRRVAADHFKIYTYGIRNNMAIIDSDKTLICLRNAASFIAHLAREKRSRFMFVNTNPLFDEIVEQMTKKMGLYSTRDAMLWKMGGFLTNSFSPKRFRSRNKKVCFPPIQPPDCVVVLDTERKSSVILEADRLQIPIVALVDSSMPWEFYKRISYPVPANDSVQFVYLFCNIITKIFLLEQKKLRALKGDVVKEELDVSTKESSEEERQIEQSKGERKINSLMDEVLVVPYQSVESSSNDIAATKELLDKLVVVKFNDKLGTAMGFDGPKSSIEVCNGLTSLDLIINQVECLNSKYGCNIPLLVMNTTGTHGDTLKVVRKYSKSNVDILPLCGVGNSREHVVGASESEQEWDKFGTRMGQHPQQESLSGKRSQDKLYLSDHAAVFLSLMKSGTLDLLLSQGKEYVHVVSSDNVAVAIDPNILNHLVQNKIEYCMEVTPTTSSYSLFTQCPRKYQLAEIMLNHSRKSVEEFQFIDTKSLWLNLKAIKRLVDTDALKIENLSSSRGDFIGTPKMETGLESGWEQGETGIRKLFGQSVGISIPQSRFVPLDATADLLLLQSDLYSIIDGILVRNKARINPSDPLIDLGPEFHKVSDFHSRFKSIPSIVGLESLKVTGDVWFGTGVTLKGKVNINAKRGIRLEIPDGTILKNKVINDPADI